MTSVKQLLCAKHCPTYFICNVSFNPPTMLRITDDKKELAVCVHVTGRAWCAAKCKELGKAGAPGSSWEMHLRAESPRVCQLLCRPRRDEARVCVLCIYTYTHTEVKHVCWTQVHYVICKHFLYSALSFHSPDGIYTHTCLRIYMCMYFKFTGYFKINLCILVAPHTQCGA